MNEKEEARHLEISSFNMMSGDFKVRFIAEYVQVKIRADRLERMLKAWDDGTLTFTPSCPRWLLEKQLHFMQSYQESLEIRAAFEKIELPDG